jgi:hypothetical protein
LGEGLHWLHAIVLRSQEDPNPVSLNAFATVATCNVFAICSKGGGIGTPTGVRSSQQVKLMEWI